MLKGIKGNPYSPDYSYFVLNELFTQLLTGSGKIDEERQYKEGAGDN